MIEVNMTVDVDNNLDVESLVMEVQTILANINGEQTTVSVVNADNPITTNPLNFRVGR